MQAACTAAGNPERAYSVIQLTGTNGKTSTSRIIDELLQAEGMNTALYTSPPLLCDTERIRVGGVDISMDDLVNARRSARAAASSVDVQLSEFEEFTLACLIYLRDKAVDLAVLEVGMGGRWDATSAANPSVAVITGIGLDHMEFLGDTIEEIAFDKSHIIKPGCTPVLANSVQHPPHIVDIFLDRARSFGLHPRCVTTDNFTIHTSTPTETAFEVTTPHAYYTGLHIAAPAYQASNAATALFAAEAALGRVLDADCVRTALATVTFPGRFEVLRTDPLLVFDGSHNPQAAETLADLIAQTTAETGQKPTIVLGILADKDAAGIIKALAPQAADFIAIEPPSPRALPAAELARLIREVTGKSPLAPHHALKRAGMDVLCQALNMTGKQPVVITGSLSLYPLLQSLRLNDGDI